MNPRQEIVFVVDWFTPSSHATSLRVRPWVDELRSAGNFEVLIYTDCVSKGEEGVWPNFFHSPDNRHNKYRRVFQELVLGIELFFRLLLGKKRLVVISSPPFLAAAFAAAACRFSGKPYVFDVRDVYPLVYADSGYLQRNGNTYRFFDWLARRCYTHAFFTTTVTPQLVTYLQSNCKASKFFLVKNGYNSKLFVPAREKNKIFTLVFHGNIGQFQYPELLIEVIKELNHRNEKVECIVIGSGSRQGVFEANHLSNLKFLGRLNNEELATIISKAHVGISFRTDNEVSARSIPVRVSEYIGVGIPSILTPRSEGGEVLEQFNVGKAFDNNQLQEICDFIVQLKCDEQLYLDYHQNIMKVRPNFSREAGAEHFRMLVEKYCLINSPEKNQQAMAVSKESEINA